MYFSFSFEWFTLIATQLTQLKPDWTNIRYNWGRPSQWYYTFTFSPMTFVVCFNSINWNFFLPWNARNSGAPDNVKYVLSSQDDGLVAYRIVEMSDDDTKPSMAHANNETATMPQQLQYIVIDNVNGYLQAMPTPTSIAASTVAAISSSCSSNSTTSSTSIPVSTSRPSITIAPKIVKTETSKYANAAPISSTKQSVRILHVWIFTFIDFVKYECGNGMFSICDVLLCFRLM